MSSDFFFMGNTHRNHHIRTDVNAKKKRKLHTVKEIPLLKEMGIWNLVNPQSPVIITTQKTPTTVRLSHTKEDIPLLQMMGLWPLLKWSA